MSEPIERVWCIALLPNGMPCHKPLRDEESKRRLIGPKCWRRMTTPIGRVRQALPAVPTPGTAGPALRRQRRSGRSVRTVRGVGMSAQQTPVCAHWAGARQVFCGYPHGVKYFVIGWRRAVHTPTKVREWAEEQARTAAGDAS